MERDLALSQGALARDLNRWIEERFDLPASQLPDLSQESDPEAAADSLRQLWGLGQMPIGKVVHLLEKQGVRVFSLAVESLHVDAYSMWNNQKPFMMLNTMKSAERSRFDAAHELGHLVLHRHALKEDTRLAEDEANRFASAFLMPRAGTIARAPKLVTIQRLIEHKKYWFVSVAALNQRLHELKVTNDWQHRHLAAEISRLSYRKIEPEPGQRESSQLLSKVLSALRDTSNSQRDIAGSLAYPPSEIEKLIFGLAMTSIDGGVKDRNTAAGSPPKLQLVR